MTQDPAASATLAAGNVELAFHVAKLYLRRARAIGAFCMVARA